MVFLDLLITRVVMQSGPCFEAWPEFTLAKASGLLRINSFGVRLASRGKLFESVPTGGVGSTASAIHYSPDPFSVV